MSRVYGTDGVVVAKGGGEFLLRSFMRIFVVYGVWVYGVWGLGLRAKGLGSN